MGKHPAQKNKGPVRRVDPLKSRIECCTLPSGRHGELHYLPRFRTSIMLDPSNEISPIEAVVKLDGSFEFHRSPSGPVARMATSKGDLILNSMGLVWGGKSASTGKSIPWTDGRGMAKALGTLAYGDIVFQQAVSLVPGSIGTVIDPCGLIREGIDIVKDIGRTIKECTQEFIPAVVETVDQTAQCIGNAGSAYGSCNSGCGRKKWWRRPGCYAGCAGRYAADVAWCIANGIVQIVIEAARTIEHCVLHRGAVTGEVPASGDIILFEADSIAGHAIDFATCGYGYSHAGLLCGSNIIEATGGGVVEHPFSDVSGRDHAVVRLGLTAAQVAALCKCVHSQIGADFDYIEGITFGTVNDPGREICSMLIMHCLDQIGFDRGSVGLGGFVSPNDIARAFDVPHGHLV